MDSVVGGKINFSFPSRQIQVFQPREFFQRNKSDIPCGMKKN